MNCTTIEWVMPGLSARAFVIHLKRASCLKFNAISNDRQLSLYKWFFFFSFCLCEDYLSKETKYLEKHLKYGTASPSLWELTVSHFSHKQTQSWRLLQSWKIFEIIMEFNMRIRLIKILPSTNWKWTHQSNIYIDSIKLKYEINYH